VEKKKNKIGGYFIRTLLSGALLLEVGCTDSEILQEINRSSGDVYVSVSVSSTGVSTKATGGENGDGLVVGLDYENTINDLTLLFYAGTNGVNGNAATPIVSSLTLVDVVQSGVYTSPQKVRGLTVGQTYNVLVIANAGNLSLPATLGGVRDFLLSTAWKEESSAYSRFVMTSSSDATIEIKAENNTLTNPALVTVPIERVGARVDYLPKAAGSGLAANQYSVLDNGSQIATVTVDKIKLINRLSVGSFLLKRVAAAEGSAPNTSISSTYTYLGDETQTSAVQTNYVVDPWSISKRTENRTIAAFLIGGQQQPAERLYIGGNYLFSAGFTVDDAPLVQAPISGENFYVLGYSQENTMAQSYQINAYTTGVVFETTYVPTKVLALQSGSLVEEPVTGAITFYAYNKKIYKTPEAVTFDTTIPETNFESSGVKKYTNGKSYYFYWIRHSDNNDPDVQGIMEFAVVRNNIYKLQIELFSGLGSADLKKDPQTPVESENLQMKVVVRKWNIINHSPVYL